MGLFGNSDSDEGAEEMEEEEVETLPHQMMSKKISLEVAKVNKWIRRVNNEGWDLYLVPEDPSFTQLQKQDTELKRLYDKISENRPTDKEERAKVLHTRQALRELMEVYKVYDAISRPTQDSSIQNNTNSSSSEGGASNAV
jgi:hypothetical protein